MSHDDDEWIRAGRDLRSLDPVLFAEILALVRAALSGYQLPVAPYPATQRRGNS